VQSIHLGGKSDILFLNLNAQKPAFGRWYCLL